MVSGRSHVCEGPKEDENRYAHNAKARSGFGTPLGEGGGNANALQLEPNQSFSAELCPGCSEGILLKNMPH